MYNQKELLCLISFSSNVIKDKNLEGEGIQTGKKQDKVADIELKNSKGRGVCVCVKSYGEKKSRNRLGGGTKVGGLI